MKSEHEKYLETLTKIIDDLHMIDDKIQAKHALLWFLIAKSKDGLTIEDLSEYLGGIKEHRNFATRFKSKFLELGLIANG